MAHAVAMNIGREFQKFSKFILFFWLGFHLLECMESHQKPAVCMRTKTNQKQIIS